MKPWGTADQFLNGTYKDNSRVYIGDSFFDTPDGCGGIDVCARCNYGLFGRFIWPKTLFLTTSGRFPLLGEPEFVNQPLFWLEGSDEFCIWGGGLSIWPDPTFPSFAWGLTIFWDPVALKWQFFMSWTGLLDGALMHPYPAFSDAIATSPFALVFKFQGRISPSVVVGDSLPMWVSITEFPQ